MALATLSIDIVARLSKLEQDMGQAARIAEKNSERIQSSLNRITSTAKTLGGSIAGLFTVTEIAQFVGGTIDAVDALNDVKDATGASVENISALEAIALRTGATLDDVAGILVKFNGVLKEADGKNGVSMALKAIGLDVAELRRMDPAEALRVTAVALAGYADDGNKARIVQELFGKSIREAAPFLNDLAAAGKLVATVTAEQADEAEKFNKQLFALQENVSRASRSLVSDLLPAMNSVLDRFNKGGLTAALGFDEKFFDTKQLAGAAEKLRQAKAELDRTSGVGVAGTLYRSMVLPDRAGRELAQAQARFDAAKAEFNAQKQAFDQKDRERTMGELMKPYVPRRQSDKPSIGDLPAAPAKAKKAALKKVSEADRYLATLEKQLQKTRELTTVETLLDDIQNKRIDGLTAKSAGVLFDRAAEIDQARELDDAFEDLYRRLDDQRTAANAAQQEATRYFEAALTPAEKLSAELEHINELYNQGAFGAVGSEDAMNKVARAIDGAKANTDKLTDGAKELADALKDAVFQGKDLVDALLAIAMKRFVFEPLSASIDGLFSSVLGGVGKSAGVSTGSGGSGALDLLATVGSFFGGFFADGGHLPAGKWGIAGERGPEPIFGGRTGLTVIPNGGGRAAAGGQSSGGPSVSLVQHISIADGASRSELYAGLQAVRQQIMADLAYSMENRGRFA
ncbi:MAG: hypothetical protein EOP38_24940 [Rubrivivax sp.]|nr:MAG: hypothetical protein EOP38_24940 [Rubrivivax sp.]